VHFATSKVCLFYVDKQVGDWWSPTRENAERLKAVETIADISEYR